MPRTKKPKVVNESPEEVKVEVKKVATPTATTAKVLTPNGNVIRTYDLATHGEDFHDLAKQMQAQHKDSRIELT